MAAIDVYLQQILDAVYGEEVRGSIHDSIAAMNVESSTAMLAAVTARDSAKNYADSASTSETNAKNYASAAAASAEEAAQTMTKAIQYRSAITFSQLNSVEKKFGYMYNITDSFTADTRFRVEDRGKTFDPGANVVYDSNGLWDVSGGNLTMSPFTGTDGKTNGVRGLVPAPSAVDAGKFLNANGGWKEADVFPLGGYKGQFLTKKSDSDKDVDWEAGIYYFEDDAAADEAIKTGLVANGAIIVTPGGVIDVRGGGGGGTVTVDSVLSTTSTNPVQNRIITNEINSVKNNLKSGNIEFKFGVDSNGNYGYYKTGADTVTPFKNPIGEKTDTYSGNGTFTVNVLDYATHKITVNVNDTPTLQSKTVSPTTSKQTITADPTYYGLSQVVVNAIETETKTITPTTSDQTVNPTSGKYFSKVTVSKINTETKTITPTTAEQTINPTSGYYISKVTVNAIQTETKTATPSTSPQDIIPTSGKYLTKVTVSAIQTETKTITPNASDQTVTPTSGKYFSSVTVSKISTETASVTLKGTSQTITPTSGKYLTSVIVPAVVGTADKGSVLASATFSSASNPTGATGTIITRNDSGNTTISAGSTKSFSSGYYPNNHGATAESLPYGYPWYEQYFNGTYTNIGRFAPTNVKSVLGLGYNHTVYSGGSLYRSYVGIRIREGYYSGDRYIIPAIAHAMDNSSNTTFTFKVPFVPSTIMIIEYTSSSSTYILNYSDGGSYGFRNGTRYSISSSVTGGRIAKVGQEISYVRNNTSYTVHAYCLSSTLDPTYYEITDDELLEEIGVEEP